MVGDGFLDPVPYALDHTSEIVAVRAYQVLNRTSLTIGDYESLKKAALDPYVAVRDAYYQNRKAKIEE
jgi:phospholipid-binding lipoprotein MlaA